MDYMENIFKKMDLKQIRSFILSEGLDISDVEKGTYKDRLENGSDSTYKRLESIYTNEEELDKAASDLSKALMAYESVYMEIGMKFGARMIFQLLNTDDKVERGN